MGIIKKIKNENTHIRIPINQPGFKWKVRDPGFFSWLNLDIQISGPGKPLPPGESRAKNRSEGGSQEKFSGETMGSLGSFWEVSGKCPASKGMSVVK